MREVDTLVVGAGPAGSATALALARAGCSVVVVERSRYHAWRPGESLAAAAHRLLDAMGVLGGMDAELAMPSRASHHAWGAAELVCDDQIFSPYGDTWHVDRRRFDAWLADTAEAAGATVLRGCRVRSMRHTGGRWLVELDGARLAARVAVDATGRAAWVARTAGARWLSHDRLVGVSARLAPAASGPAAAVDSHLLLEAIEEGWWYSVRLPDGSLVATLMTDDDAVHGHGGEALWRAALARASHTLARVAGRAPVGGVRVRSAASGRLDRAAGTDWIAVGDAASAYDPLSSDGIHKALRSGFEASRRILAWLAGDDRALAGHTDDVSRGFTGYLRQRAKHYHREQRWPRSMFWRRRQPPDPHALPVTIDPSHRLAWRGDASDAETADVAALLPRHGVPRLCRLCGPGHAAHEVVAAFQRASTVDDRSVIVALQLLRDRGVLAAL